MVAVDSQAKQLARHQWSNSAGEEPILTLPEEVKDRSLYLPVGNEYISIPFLAERDASIGPVNLVLHQARGLVEFSGGQRPFLLPVIEIDGRPLKWDGQLTWERRHGWIPSFSVMAAGRGPELRALQPSLPSPDVDELPVSGMWGPLGQPVDSGPTADPDHPIDPAAAKVAIQGTVFAPPGYQGAVYLLQAQNLGQRAVSLFLGWEGCWRRTLQTIYSSRTVGGLNWAGPWRWGQNLVLESRPGLSLAALAIGASRPVDCFRWSLARASGRGASKPWSLGVPGPELSCANPVPREWSTQEGLRLLFLLGQRYRLEPGQAVDLALYLAAAPEADGAGAHLIDLQRRGWRVLLKENCWWLEARLDRLVENNTTGLDLKGLSGRAVEAVGDRIGGMPRESRPDGPGGEFGQVGRRGQAGHGQPDGPKPGEEWWFKGLGTVGADLLGTMISNLCFGFFYTAAKTIDTQEYCLLTSRSPAYYVSGAFWSRDAWLWSFPALVLLDADLARRILLSVWPRHLAAAGVHSHYLDGAVLYPGFELDQLAAPIVALGHYLDQSGDWSVVEEAPIKAGLKDWEPSLQSWQDVDTGLYATYLDPSDDPVDYPYLTYDNVLVWKALKVLSAIYSYQGNRDKHQQLSVQAQELKAALRRHAVVNGPLGPMWAWSIDGQGNYRLYDNPPGSLQLLPFYGFCSPDDPVYLNTLAWIYSSHNPYYYPHACPPGLGGVHAANPWPLAAASALLVLAGPSGEEVKTLAVEPYYWQALRFFQEARMDNGLGCESVDPASGKVKTGAAFASAAGFIGYALYRALASRALRAGRADGMHPNVGLEPES